ncbi:DUF2703 domain-containing protein [hot springs metagenome]|uniref:DUF2703 domain-containing protein n=1 Tax=hot springs metagenome TaxID=433727 RepID=A0A5J4L3G9_9ZZZZ
MLILRIRWQRLVEGDGKTCPRCGNTEKELQDAFLRLKEALGVLGFQVEMEKYAITPEDFKKDPLSSNRIWINDKSLEEWLGARTGQSQCCDVCGDSECRTTVAGDHVYETIPASLVIKAGLIAAAEMLPVERPMSEKKRFFATLRMTKS